MYEVNVHGLVHLYAPRKESQKGKKWNKTDEKDREQSDGQTCPMRPSKIFM